MNGLSNLWVYNLDWSFWGNCCRHDYWHCYCLFDNNQTIGKYNLSVVLHFITKFFIIKTGTSTCLCIVLNIENVIVNILDIDINIVAMMCDVFGAKN